jgi:hypothetical protein
MIYLERFVTAFNIGFIIAISIGCNPTNGASKKYSENTNKANGSSEHFEKYLNEIFKNRWMIDKGQNRYTLRPSRRPVFISMFGRSPHDVRELIKIEDEEARNRFLEEKFQVQVDYYFIIREADYENQESVDAVRNENLQYKGHLYKLKSFESSIGEKRDETAERKRNESEYKAIWQKIRPLPFGHIGNKTYYVSVKNIKRASFLNERDRQAYIGKIVEFQRKLHLYQNVELRYSDKENCAFNRYAENIPMTCPW